MTLDRPRFLACLGLAAAVGLLVLAMPDAHPLAWAGVPLAAVAGWIAFAPERW